MLKEYYTIAMILSPLSQTRTAVTTPCNVFTRYMQDSIHCHTYLATLQQSIYNNDKFKKNLTNTENNINVDVNLVRGRNTTL